MSFKFLKYVCKFILDGRFLNSIPAKLIKTLLETLTQQYHLVFQCVFKNDCLILDGIKYSDRDC